ncbi:3-hydroxy-3-methylglutaryl-coenzyme A synthase 2 [Heterostelium album PN500]|uniref:Hydroxymethylglutaryl-CoA synthase n=1 Tax=Heterostelium pallidum (strain ATCC 26659 / Pp 5 / PN500) TaxID=670386 RepID=D3AXQ3_HETP5|nr:3-hydroxy-3-methylglutaryl-coenzyme A synthase 2 [Heterostelium album PN500]EFA85730.1 3-hydroxy-3-methylglutaryl-coenzyme A synthase 2 [Heterostelium album PN500]|eukprot:XP_020437836.1 3-hydroxy-3-methylglutaryl-coenzyme A synthase 2 [Heterostelium album PN500]
MNNDRPQNIGILAMDIYFPETYVAQTELESFDGVSAGKYTIGLGQTNMAFCGDREDIVSMSMNSVQSLMKKYNIPYSMIGRLEVGTETIIDKSKSIKTHLMTLFQEHGNTSIEGVDTYNACYGGTNALFNSVQWIESSYWDGRFAMVVTGDIAVYAKGPARPTGGAGVVAMLIGPNAPLVMEPGIRGVHMENVYDFYKPDGKSEYPYVDGKLSIDCYLRALDRCYANYKAAFERLNQDQNFSMDLVDYCVMHSPYGRLVQKSFGRLFYNDYILSGGNSDESSHKYKDHFQEFNQIGLGKESYGNAKLDQVGLKVTDEHYKNKVIPSMTLSKELGNCYAGSVYGGILSLLSNVNSLVGKRVLVFSYGSGLAATFFSFKGVSTNNPMFPSTENIGKQSNINQRLTNRIKISPPEFTTLLSYREENCSKLSYTPMDSTLNIAIGNYYLERVDDKLIRHYKIKDDTIKSSLYE